MLDEIDFTEINEYIDELVNDGLTWDEIGELCNDRYGKAYSSSKWRKPYQIWRKTIDSVIYDNSDKIVEKELRRIAKAKSRLDINRQIINQQRSLLNEDIRNASLVEIFNDTVLSVLMNKQPDLRVDTQKSQTTLKSASNEPTEPINYLFVKSDGHYNGNQDLDLEFSEFYSIIADKKDIYNFNEIVIAELGDTIEGASLRPSQLLAVKNGMVEQAMVVANYYIDFLNLVTSQLGVKVKFVIVESSNHTQLRPLGSGRSELPMEDLMVLISEMIALGVANNDLVEIISDDIIRKNINGISYLFEHGHDAPSSNYLEKRESYYNKSFDFAYMGHFHHYNSRDIYEIDGRMANKNVTFVPHSCTVESSFEKVKHLSSVPAIHFSIDTLKGKKHQENVVLEKSYLKMKEEELKGKHEKSKIIRLK